LVPFHYVTLSKTSQVKFILEFLFLEEEGRFFPGKTSKKIIPKKFDFPVDKRPKI